MSQAPRIGVWRATGTYTVVIADIEGRCWRGVHFGNALGRYAPAQDYAEPTTRRRRRGRRR